MTSWDQVHVTLGDARRGLDLGWSTRVVPLFPLATAIDIDLSPAISGEHVMQDNWVLIAQWTADGHVLTVQDRGGTIDELREIVSGLTYDPSAATGSA
jgi:hypothetical protein